MSIRGYRSYRGGGGTRVCNDQFWVHTTSDSLLMGGYADSSAGRSRTGGRADGQTPPLVPGAAAIASENVKMERRRSHRARHAEVYARHRRLDNCLMASVTILSLLVTLTVCGLVTWAVIAARMDSSGGTSSGSIYNESLQQNGGGLSSPPLNPTRSYRIVPDAFPSTTQLNQLTQLLWDLDTHRLPDNAFQVNLQGRVFPNETTDRADQRFFTSLDIPLEVYSSTFRTFINLQNDFVAATQQEDPFHVDKMEDMEDFLDAVLDTPIMNATHSFLYSIGVLGPSLDDLHHLLYDLWFSPYSRKVKYTTLDSSGFEHVFSGETRGTKVIGFHSWIKFFLEERKGALNYHGYIAVTEPRVLTVQFSWNNCLKQVSSFFLGTSPEFDLSVYTICIILFPGRICSFSIDHNPVRIQTYDMTQVSGLQVGTAYPVVDFH